MENLQVKKIIHSVPKKYYVIALTLTAIIGSFFFFGGNGDVDYDYIVAEKSDLRQEISVTGKVKPASKVNLAFESTGKVQSILVDVSSKVYAGQRLASLNNSQYQAQYNQAKASWEAEKSTLEELLKGTRPEEIAVQSIKVQNAEQSLLDAKLNLINKVKDAYLKSDDAVRNKADQLFDNPRSSNPQLNFVAGIELENVIEAERLDIETVLNSWMNSVLGKDVDINNLDFYTHEAKENLNKINYFLDRLALAVNGMSVTSGLTQTIIDGYRADVNTARTNVSTASINLTTAEENTRTNNSALLLVKQELSLKEAGSTSQQIKTQEARTESAKANMDNYSALIAKTIIYSPISGIVTKQELEKGEIVQSNEIVISVISGSEFEIETFIPEADIAKLKIGDKAEVTLDAYESDVVFEAEVVMIDPAETIIEGVSTYKSVLQFAEKDERIRSGMTANIEILTAHKENVIAIPYRYLNENGRDYVKVLNEKERVIEKDVQTGMRGSDGRIEIVTGLDEGDKVIID